MAKNSFSAFSDKLTNMQKNINKELEAKVRIRSEILAGDARAACPVDEGNLQNSIEGFVETEKDAITGGVVTVNEYAAYVEFGTGPVGTQTGGHPLDSELGIVRKTEPWLANIPDVGVRYVHGQKANPYMYTAMKQNEKDILDDFGSVLKEVISSG